MRTLIQIQLRQPLQEGDVAGRLETWLDNSGFRPQRFELPEEARVNLLHSEEATPQEPYGSELDIEIARRHAIDILQAIPLVEQERQHALSTGRFVVHFDDYVHGSIVWGLVCIDAPSVTFRWRHRVSRSLERATEELVEKIWLSSNDDSTALFRPFTSSHSIPVREPRSTTDAYVGEILQPGPRLVSRARKDKKTEVRVALWSFVGTAICFVAGFVLFLCSQPEGTLRWISGAFDRLATTGAATAVVSYLSYRFHLQDLQRKPIIDWK